MEEMFQTDSSNVTYDTTRDYTSLTLDAGISLLDGTYTRQMVQTSILGLYHLVIHYSCFRLLVVLEG